VPDEIDFRRLYAGFNSPITDLDCGTKCAPYNGGVPVCCDTHHSVPTAYLPEWGYLEANTDLWHLWQPSDERERSRLAHEAGPDLVLIECLGAAHCQREYRSLVCRSFPFFPYLDSQHRFLGLSGYWEYEDRCWVLSNLQRVTPQFVEEFFDTYETVFVARPDELETYHAHSAHMRTVFQEIGRAVPLIRRDGGFYRVDPQDETMRHSRPGKRDKFGPFAIADGLPFPDEI